VSRSSATPRICRIDQPHKHNHGFFVRVQRAGKIHSAFFSDKKFGSREKSLAAAQRGLIRLRRRAALVKSSPRRWNAEVVRRRGKSGIHGVQRIIDRGVKPWRKYWKATWSPELGKVARKQFSIRKHGEEKAKRLAIRARRAGLRKMI